MHCSLRWFNKHHCLSRKVQEWWCHLIITWHCIATTLNHLGLAKLSILQQRQERQIIKIWNAISCLVDMEFVFNFQSRANINLFSFACRDSRSWRREIWKWKQAMVVVENRCNMQPIPNSVSHSGGPAWLHSVVNQSFCVWMSGIYLRNIQFHQSPPKPQQDWTLDSSPTRRIADISSYVSR